MDVSKSHARIRQVRRSLIYLRARFTKTKRKSVVETLRFTSNETSGNGEKGRKRNSRQPPERQDQFSSTKTETLGERDVSSSYCFLLANFVNISTASCYRSSDHYRARAALLHRIYFERSIVRRAGPRKRGVLAAYHERSRTRKCKIL